MIKEALLLEYEKIKDEQRARISIRENLFYITLIVVGAVFSSLLPATGLEFGYLALTPVLFVVSNSYYYNDEMIGRMNDYIREVLAPKLGELSEDPAVELFSWESYNRKTRRKRRRVYQTIANFILYPGASATAIIFFWSAKTQLSDLEKLFSAVCVLMTALMLIQVIYYSDIFPKRRA
jgi:uncharacterized membrane protein